MKKLIIILVLVVLLFNSCGEHIYAGKENWSPMLVTEVTLEYDHFIYTIKKEGATNLHSEMQIYAYNDVYDFQVGDILEFTVVEK